MDEIPRSEKPRASSAEPVRLASSDLAPVGGIQAVRATFHRVCTAHDLAPTRRGWRGRVFATEIAVYLFDVRSPDSSLGVRVSWGAYWPRLPFKLLAGEGVRGFRLSDCHLSERIFDSTDRRYDDPSAAAATLTRRLARLYSHDDSLRLVTEMQQSAKGRSFVRLSAVLACLAAEQGYAERAHAALHHVMGDLGSRALSKRIEAYISKALTDPPLASPDAGKVREARGPR